MTAKPTHDAYIAAAPEQFRAVLSRLRAQLARALPDAEEVVRYDMPGFQIDGAIVAGYAAFSRQCGLYVDPAAIAAHADEIAAQKLKATRTGVTFPASRPISDELVEKLALGSRKAKGLEGSAVDAVGRHWSRPADISTSVMPGGAGHPRLPGAIENHVQVVDTRAKARA